METLYIERDIAEHARVRGIVERFPRARQIECERYGEVFNRRAQNFRIQKQDPALILAQKFDNFVLPAPAGYGIGGHNNYYFSHMLNCLYDCRYCFLQGMYQSAHYLLFVNYEKFMDEIREVMLRHEDEQVYFFSGYDCDSLALESVTGFAGAFLPFFEEHPRAWLELRTKSVRTKELLARPPIDNCVVAYSLTPDEVAKAVEHKAPPVASRISAMGKVARAGWKVGLRLDPLIYRDDFQAVYGRLIEDIFREVEPSAIHSVSFGPMRFPQSMYDGIVKLYPKERLFAGSLEKRKSMVSYSSEVEDAMMTFCRETLRRYVPDSVFFACLPEVT